MSWHQPLQRWRSRGNLFPKRNLPPAETQSKGPATGVGWKYKLINFLLPGSDASLEVLVSKCSSGWWGFRGRGEGQAESREGGMGRSVISGLAVALQFHTGIAPSQDWRLGSRTVGVILSQASVQKSLTESQMQAGRWPVSAAVQTASPWALPMPHSCQLTAALSARNSRTLDWRAQYL